MAQDKGYSRRDFFRLAGMAGAGSVLLPGCSTVAAGPEPEKPVQPTEIPMRPLGNTGVKVSCLALGGMFDIPSNQLLLKQALKWGVTYWDTADCYEGGNSEIGIGQFLAKYPEARQKIFLATKSDRRDPNGLSDLLDRGLQRMNTDHVDLYMIHGMGSMGELHKDTRAWVEKTKSKGKIKFFGFSAHSNMEELMVKSAKLGWIDTILISYNFRLMRSDKMRAAVEACSKAGIGLIAMKTQGGGPVSIESETELELAGRFMKKGFTDAQAKLKAVWEEPGIASICSQMPSMTVLMSNVSAALDQIKLSAAELELFSRHAAETASGYCAGCTNICEPALSVHAPVGDIMRYLMYHNSYGDVERARACFAQIPPAIRARLETVDYSRAEKLCPQGLPIGEIVKKATTVLA